MDTPKVKINVDDIDLKSDNVEENDTVQGTSGFQNETRQLELQIQMKTTLL